MPFCGKNPEDTDMNNSRLCTKVRWVIEARNRSIKTFKALGKIIPNQTIPHVMKDLQIACAMINAFFPKLQSDNDNVSVAYNLLGRQDKKNLLQDVVKKMNLNPKKTIFQELENIGPESMDVPFLSLEDLMDLGGPFNFKNTAGYFHDQDDNLFKVAIEDAINYDKFGIAVEDPVLVKAQVHSRHQKRTKYYTYVLFDMSQGGSNSLVEHYCTCNAGARTVECCSHCFLLVWYLCWARFNPEVPINAVKILQYLTNELL